MAIFILGTAARAQYSLIVTNSPTGSNQQGSWQGVFRLNVASNFGPIALGIGIDKSLVNDPAGLCLSSAGELFVGNRHGNQNPSSVSSFVYDFATDSYLPNGTITGNSLFGTHGINLSTTGELLCANVNGPISRFTPSGNSFVANGTFGSGLARDVLVSPNGQWAYVTSASGTLSKYSLPSGNLVNVFTINGATSIHWGSWRGNDLFLGDFGTGNIYQVTLNVNSGDVISSAPVVNVPAGIAVAFSPDQQEMFVTSHTGNTISRFKLVSNAWIPNGVMDLGSNLGDIQVVPAQGITVRPSVMALQLGRNNNGATVNSLKDGGDADELEACKGFIPNLSSPYLRMTVTANNTGLSTIVAGRLDVRARSVTVGSFKMTISAKLAGGTGAVRDVKVVNPLTTTFTDIPLSLTNGTGTVNDYLGSGGSLGCQIEVQQVGFSATATPCVRIDKVNWVVKP